VSDHQSRDVAGSMNKYLLQSKSENTVKKYRGYFRHFQSFCKDNNLVDLPAQPICVSMYITHLLDQGKSYSVVSSVVYAIKWMHSLNDVRDPTEQNIVKLMLDAAKRIASKPREKKDVVDNFMLQELCEKYENSQDTIEIRDLCMIMLGFAGFLRYNEISNLRCNDIVFHDNHISLRIRSSKTDQYREGREVVIANGKTCACPVSLLRRYISIADLSVKSEDFLFKPAFRSKKVASLILKNKKLSYTRAREVIVKKLKSVAPNAKLGTHSLRASGATMAANTPGMSDRCLKRHGRWKTDIAKDGYIVDSLEKKLKITQALKL
jgi:integrase